MQTQHARGGAKPRMIRGYDLPITMNTGRKFGMYEISHKRDVIARRVELPEWLSIQVRESKVDSLTTCLNAQIPPEGLRESHGHIFVSPPVSLFTTPAVGLDIEVYDRVLASPEIKTIEFHVYGYFYQQVGLWRIDAETFIERAKYVKTKPCFMPQMMVSLTDLTNGRVPTIH